MKDADAPAFVVHAPAHVRAVFEAAETAGLSAVAFWSAPNAVLYQGTAWLRLTIELIAPCFSAVAWTLTLDCGDAPGMALAALDESGVAVALPDCAPAIQAKVAAIASGKGKRLTTTRPHLTDMLKAHDAAALRHALPMREGASENAAKTLSSRPLRTDS